MINEKEKEDLEKKEPKIKPEKSSGNLTKNQVEGLLTLIDFLSRNLTPNEFTHYKKLKDYFGFKN